MEGTPDLNLLQQTISCPKCQHSTPYKSAPLVEHSFRLYPDGGIRLKYTCTCSGCGVRFPVVLHGTYHGEYLVCVDPDKSAAVRTALFSKFDSPYKTAEFAPSTASVGHEAVVGYTGEDVLIVDVPGSEDRMSSEEQKP